MAGGNEYISCHCRDCDLFQTVGEIADISPDYIGLDAHNLDADHVYLQTVAKRPAFEQWLSMVKRYGFGTPGVTVLDIGCGVGGFLDFAASEGFRTFGFDASSAQVAKAQQRHPRVANFFDLDSYVSSLGGEPKFDLITMWDVFEHIRTPADFLAAARRHLKPGGLIFVSVPSGAPNPMKVRLARLRRRQPGLDPWEHVFYYTRPSLRRMFEQNGFEVADLGAVTGYVRPFLPFSLFNTVRSIAIPVLNQTRWALQLYAIARPRR